MRQRDFTWRVHGHERAKKEVLMDPYTCTCLLGSDPVDRLLTSSEPGTRWLTLTGVLGLPVDDPAVVSAHAAVIADPVIRSLIERLPDWEADNAISGHDRPLYAPNLLRLLADMGVAAADDPRIGRVLDSMLSHQDEEGRFQGYGRLRGRAPEWHSLLCDNHAIAEALLQFGRGDDARVRRALDRMSDDLAHLAQGQAWPCLPEPATSFRGPGRKADFCPLVTLQALRAFSRLSIDEQPGWLVDAARVVLRAWLERGSEKPYMFGHGRQFKRVKWPATWYNSLTVLDAVGRYPELWASSDSRADDVRAIAEITACLIAYNVDPATGMVTPRSCFQGFEEFSFGQKKRPSPYATARVLAALARVADLADAIQGVNVLTLTSSKGGAGTALGP
jgi:hypothetical protein